MSAPSWSDWPELLRRVAECCGGGTALTLAATYGGREVYIPRPDAIDETHHLALALGLGPARRMADELGGGRIIIPLGPASTIERRKQLMRQMRREGRSNGEVAGLLGVHRRTVELRHQTDRRLGLAGRADTRTRDMFDD